MYYCDLIVAMKYLERVLVTTRGHPGLVMPDGGALVWSTRVILVKNYPTTTHQPGVPWFGECSYYFTALMRCDPYYRK